MPVDTTWPTCTVFAGIKQTVSVSNTNIMETDAPVLEGLLTDPILHEHGSHGAHRGS